MNAALAVTGFMNNRPLKIPQIKQNKKRDPQYPLKRVREKKKEISHIVHELSRVRRGRRLWVVLLLVAIG